jgi:hypothetical protein
MSRVDIQNATSGNMAGNHSYSADATALLLSPDQLRKTFTMAEHI